MMLLHAIVHNVHFDWKASWVGKRGYEETSAVGGASLFGSALREFALHQSRAQYMRSVPEGPKEKRQRTGPQSARPAMAAGGEDRAIPIITYHRVGGAMDPNAVDGVDQGRVELSEFERQMAHLAEAGVAVVTHAEIVEWLRGGPPPPLTTPTI